MVLSKQYNLSSNYEQYKVYKIDMYPKSPSKNPPGLNNPGQQNLQYQDIQVRSYNANLKGWLVKQKISERIIIYFHQNAGNNGFRIPFMKHLSQQTNSDVLLIAYRGYSDSQGYPYQQGIKKDSKAIINKCLEINQQKKKPIYIFGRSLGGAVAIYASSLPQFQEKIKGVILQNTFTRLKDVAYHLFSFLWIFKSPILWLLLNNYWNSIQRIKNIKARILFIKCRRDQLVPTVLMDKLQNQARSHDIRTKQYQILFGTHNQSWTIELEQYFTKLIQFFKETQQNK